MVMHPTEPENCRFKCDQGWSTCMDKHENEIGGEATCFQDRGECMAKCGPGSVPVNPGFPVN